MYKKCLLFICVVFIIEVKSDCGGILECFDSFFTSFFTKSDVDVKYINTTSKNLPEEFVQVKDVQISELNKVLSEISSFVQQDIADQLKTQSDAAFFANVNPKTKVYVKTFTYNNPGNVFFPDFSDANFEQESITSKNLKDVIVEDESFNLLTTPSTSIVKKYENEILETKNNTKEDLKKEKDIRENEIPISDDIVSYYDSDEDNSTDYPIIDYIEMYKDTTNEENIYIPTEVPATETEDRSRNKIEAYMDNLDNSTSENSTDVTTVFPWITTIFIKNDSKSNQFEYYCDGALLNDRALITAARCVMRGNTAVDPESLLVILGKRSLLSMVDKEQAVKIKQIITHENFTNDDGRIENDLALLVFENTVVFNDIIQPAVIRNDTEEVDKSYTTAWNLQGDLVPVALEDNEAQACKSESLGEQMFCATYGLNVALCPSYGGIFAGYKFSWQLHGVRSGDASDRGLCFSKEVWYTDLRAYLDWIMDNIE